MSSKQEDIMISPEEARALIIKPYITEKTFNLIESENILTFIVSAKANKKYIKEALRILYESQTTDINVATTIQGKKAFIKFKSPEGARELATTLGLV